MTPNDLVERTLTLISPPDTYNLLNLSIQDPKTSATDISSIINADPGLTARLLRIVNSPYYGFATQVNTISRAITIVGTSELTQLVLATSVVKAFKKIPVEFISIADFWHHSIACAVTATLIAKAKGIRAHEQLFIAGLLQNIGSIVMYQTIPDICKEAMTSALLGDEILYEAETRLLGFNHTQVGASLAEKWRFPENLIEAIRYHHTPSQALNYSTETAIVHLSDIMVTAANCFGHPGTQYVPRLDREAWLKLELKETQLPAIMEEVVIKVDQLKSTLLMN